MTGQTPTLFGIPNCDTVKKARKWLDANQLSYQFQDVREQPLTIEQLQLWAEQVGWEKLFNKRSTSYRQLEQDKKDNLNELSALALILEFPTLMKRPVLQTPEQLLVGFSDASYQSLLGQ